MVEKRGYGRSPPLYWYTKPCFHIPSKYHSTSFIYRIITVSLLLFVFFGCSDGMEREACVCDHGYERSDLCAEIIIIIIISLFSLELLDRFLRGNFSRKFWGWRGQQFLGKKTSLTRKFSGKISSPKISGNFGSDSPTRGNFEAQNFLETTGNFARKFWDHLIIEVKSVPFPSTG